MIDPHFTPPAADVSKQETAKRLALLPWVDQTLSPVSVGIIVAGSLSYGADYSVTPASDIDIQIITTPELIDNLIDIDLYDPEEVRHAIDGYKKGLYGQFSLVAEKDGVHIESHFWDKEAFIDAVTYAAENTPRLRSSITTPSTDYGFAFDGTESAVDYYGEIIDGFPVSPFPTYRIIDGKYFLCRPLTNLLGLPIVLKTNDELDAAIDTCWHKTIQKLDEARASQPGADLSIIQALPSKYKMSPVAKQAVENKTHKI